jgi:hypothetical protein
MRANGLRIVLLLRGTPSEFKAYEPIDAALTQQKTQAATSGFARMFKVTRRLDRCGRSR